MPRINRKTAPGVKKGKVQKKNRIDWLPNYRARSNGPVIDCRRPEIGCRHVVLKQDVVRFISLIPSWNELSEGLRAIVLEPGGEGFDGWYLPGIIAICAWEMPFTVCYCAEFFEAHRSVLDRVGARYWTTSDDEVSCVWTEASIRAYMLTHVFLHELGHHRDHVSRRPRKRVERFAERFALDLADRIWDRYVREFGRP